MEEEVTIIDRAILKVLATDTRMNILKELKGSNKTLSDLSKTLNKDKSTLMEHLDKLTSVGLVKRIEQPERKWVFYTLTEKGSSIISSGSKRLVILICVSILSLVGGLLSLSKYLIPLIHAPAEIGLPAPGKPIIPTVQPEQHFFYFSILLFSISIMTFILFIATKQKIKKRFEE